MTEEKSKKNIFISYSRKDTEFARKLVAWIEKKGYTAWMDQRGIHGGEDYFASIAKAIKRSEIVIPVFSRNSVNSPWVIKEIQYANEHGKPIIPVFTEEAHIPQELGVILAGIQRIDLSDQDWDTDPWISLESALGGEVLEQQRSVDLLQRNLRNAAQQWIVAGSSYDSMEKIVHHLEPWLACPKEMDEVTDTDVLKLLLLASLHKGNNWRYWIERNQTNQDAAQLLLTLLGGDLTSHLRPRLRALYALQCLDEKLVKQTIKDMKKSMPEDLGRLLETYVMTRRVPEYLKKIKDSGDPGLTAKAEAVLKEISKMFGTYEVGRGSSGLPLF